MSAHEINDAQCDRTAKDNEQGWKNGIVEFSHYASCNIALSDAAKIGARYAMVRQFASGQRQRH